MIAGIASIDVAGLASAVSEGTANITAADGAINNSTTITVTPPELVSIALSPADASVAKGFENYTSPNMWQSFCDGFIYVHSSSGVLQQ